MSSEADEQQIENQAAARQKLPRETRDFLQRQEQRRKVFARALLVGLLAGALPVAFRWALTGGDLVRTGLIAWVHLYPGWGWLRPVLFGAVGAGLAVRPGKHPSSGSRWQRDSPFEGRIVPAALAALATYSTHKVLRQ